jgi:hypothetical protein
VTILPSALSKNASSSCTGLSVHLCGSPSKCVRAAATRHPPHLCFRSPSGWVPARSLKLLLQQQHHICLIGSHPQAPPPSSDAASSAPTRVTQNPTHAQGGHRRAKAEPTWSCSISRETGAFAAMDADGAASTMLFLAPRPGTKTRRATCSRRAYTSAWAPAWSPRTGRPRPPLAKGSSGARLRLSPGAIAPAS